MLDPLRHFVLVCEHGTFREAARHAHLSQPALTASIQKLERELGATVLVRGRRGAAPTEAGRLLLPHARAALGALADARRTLEAYRGAEVGEIRLAAGATVCTYVLPPIIARFLHDHPGVSFALVETTPEEAQVALSRRDVDFTIVSGPEGRELLRDELVLVASERDPHPERSAFVSFRHGAGIRDIVDRHFPERPVVMELGSIAAVLANVRAGAGVALVSRFALADAAERRGLSIVSDPRTPLVRSLRVSHGELDTLSPAARAFLRVLEEACRGERASGSPRNERKNWRSRAGRAKLAPR